MFRFGIFWKIMFNRTGHCVIFSLYIDNYKNGISKIVARHALKSYFFTCCNGWIYKFLELVGASHCLFAWHFMHCLLWQFLTTYIYCKRFLMEWTHFYYSLYRWWWWWCWWSWAVCRRWPSEYFCFPYFYPFSKSLESCRYSMQVNSMYYKAICCFLWTPSSYDVFLSDCIVLFSIDDTLFCIYFMYVFFYWEWK